MDMQRFLPKRLAGLWSGDDLLRWRMFQPRYPPLAVEVGLDRLHLAQVDRTKEKKLIVRRYGQIELPEGAMQTGPQGHKLARPADVGAALLEALEKEGIEARGLSLVLPDHVARSSLIHLAERPRRRRETLEIIQWKLRKAVPFKVEDADIDYQIYPSSGDGGMFVCQAVLVLRSVLESYERLFEQLNLRAGLIDLSTFNLVNLYRPVLEEEAGDAFLLNVTGSFFTLIILRAGVPLFYRSKSYAFADRESAGARRAMVIREVDSSLTYYRERLTGTDPVRIHLRCVDLKFQQLAEELGEKTTAEVLRLDPGKVVEVEPRTESSDAQEEMLQRIAPALGAALGREG